MKERFITGAIIVFVVAIMFLTKIIMNITWIFDIFIGLLVILSALEFSKIAKKMGLFNHDWLIGAFPVFYYGAFILTLQLNLAIHYFLIMALSLMLLFGIISFLTTLISKTRTASEMRIRSYRGSVVKFSVQKALNTIIGFVYPTIVLMFLVMFNHIEEMGYIFSGASDQGGLLSVVILAIAFLIPFISDTFAYLTGTLIGGKKLAPNISPIKTISGAIGGVVWTIIILVVLFIIFNADTALASVFASIGLTWWHVAILAGVGAVAGVFGDLFESLIKRKAGVKDSSDLLPGHGGILDRLDSFCFTTPIVFLFFIFLL